MSSANPRTATASFIAVGLVAVIASCERPSEGMLSPGGRAGAPVTRVEVVRPERQTVRRPVAVPGQLMAYETTAM
jgi:hypothetical protein